MYNPQEDVKKFMVACSQEAPDRPTMPSPEVRLLRAKLIYEEAFEFLLAAGCQVVAHCRKTGEPLDVQDIVVEFDPHAKPSLVEMMDACADINYVSYGAAIACGIDLIKCHDEVQRSNMTKIGSDGKVIKSASGKIEKPASYKPPDLKTVLAKQGYKDAE